MKGIILFLLLGISFNSFSHGEDKYGPNNGYIRMPGAFHTELVPLKNNKFKIYLMDVNNKNITVENSSVALTYKTNGKNIDFSCTKQVYAFECETSKAISTDKGELIVKAKRLNQTGKNAVYELPLRLKGQKVEEDHSKHGM